MSEPLLRTESLSFHYGSRVALAGVDLAFEAGDIVAIAGPNGAGKSTLLRLLAGLLPPHDGRIFVAGEELRADEPETRARIGYAPQRPSVWPELTPLEQLVFMGECQGLSRAEAEHRSIALLQGLGLASRAKQRARSLSGGMQQRLSIAMALVHGPRVLLLDEPEAGVDAASLGTLRDLLRRLAEEEGTLVAYATHDEDSTRDFATRAVRLERGHLAGSRAFPPRPSDAGLASDAVVAAAASGSEVTR